MSRKIKLKSEYTGDEQVSVHIGNNKEPHLVISGASADQLDPKKIQEYIDNCDWTDRGSKGYITPNIRCDDFLKT